MRGYDLGGAEYPLDPDRLVVIDKVDPNKVWPERHEYGKHVNWYRANFDTNDIEDLTLPIVETIYVGKLLRYVGHDSARRLADWCYRHIEPGGTIEVFDQWDSMEMFAGTLLSLAHMEVDDLELVNAPFEDTRAEWSMVLRFT